MQALLCAVLAATGVWPGRPWTERHQPSG